MPEAPTPELPAEAIVVNVGLPLFADAVAQQGRPVVSVDWRIPAGGRPHLVGALARLYGPLGPVVDAANVEVLRRLDRATPHIVGVVAAGDVVALDGRWLLHSGPQITYAEACDPLRRSMRAAVVAEGWAASVEEAGRVLESGEIALAPALAIVFAIVIGCGRGCPRR